MRVVPFSLDADSHSLNPSTEASVSGSVGSRQPSPRPHPQGILRVYFAGAALPSIIHHFLSQPPSFWKLLKKKKMKQPDVSPVSSVIHKKKPSIPRSSLMLYEKLKLNQGSVIKLSDFCWIRMNSCVCHIVCWKCAWGARGL